MFKSTLVTGATGLLGSFLVKKLVKENLSKRVICLIRDSIPNSLFYSEGLHNKVCVVKGDLKDFNLINRILVEYEIDSIFHLGAQTIVQYANKSPKETLEVNILGTINILESARISNNLKCVIIASSDKAYGDANTDRYLENTSLNGVHPYDVSKSCADLISQTYYKTYGIPIGITRCGNLFGQGDLNNTRIIPSTINSCLRKESPILRSNGRPIRDYIYVEDAADAYILLAKNIYGGCFIGEAFNFSYDKTFSALEIVKIIQNRFNLNKEIKILNDSKNEIIKQCLNSEKAKNLLNWEEKIGFDTGLDLTIDWYTKFYNNEQENGN
jgi:CDP-glucose 4,6-dehydratase